MPSRVARRLGGSDVTTVNELAPTHREGIREQRFVANHANYGSLALPYTNGNLTDFAAPSIVVLAGFAGVPDLLDDRRIGQGCGVS